MSAMPDVVALSQAQGDSQQEMFFSGTMHHLAGLECNHAAMMESEAQKLQLPEQSLSFTPQHGSMVAFEPSQVVHGARDWKASLVRGLPEPVTTL